MTKRFQIFYIYYNIENPYLTTINITLSSLNDNISIEKILKDYIYINLNFKLYPIIIPNDI